MKPILIKVSGHELDDPAFLTAFAHIIRNLGEPVIIVHGGGAEISAMQKIMGIEPRYLDGVRITDPDSLKVVEMVLCGTVNKRLVRYLVATGVDAVGLSGVDRGLVRATRMHHADQDMGFTGSVQSVRGDVITELLTLGTVPVIAPVCLGEDSNYNINADHVAGAIAGAVGARQSVFLTNVPGVMVDGQVITTLSPERTEKLIAEGIIFGGMIPKVRTALAALEAGIEEAVITDLNGLRENSGTIFKRGV